jgi:hypothetical protein
MLSELEGNRVRRLTVHDPRSHSPVKLFRRCGRNSDARVRTKQRANELPLR